MAWLIGQVDEDERKELERRGWKVEPVANIGLAQSEWGGDCVSVFVDNDLFKIMSGQDWAKGE